MKELENLQNRVGLAVQKLSQSEEQRQTQNKSLSRVLNDLEIKFEARKVELDHCRSRISQLEESNKALTGLVAEMVEIVEHTADGLADDPVYRTTAGATEIINRYVGELDTMDDTASEETVAEQPSAVPAEESIAVPADEPVAPLVPEEILAAQETSFEDIDDEAVRAEDLADETMAFPKLVYDAMALASTEHEARTVDMDALEEIAAETAGATAAEDIDSDFADTAEIDVDIPDPGPAAQAPQASSDFSEGNLDIKEIMARLEAAAERAQLRADADARATETEQEQPDRAVGGRA